MNKQPSNQGLIRDSKGRFIKGHSGNPEGINAGRRPYLDLDEALAKAQREHSKSFLEHFIERAYKNDQVAIALMKKLLPDRKNLEINQFARVMTEEERKARFEHLKRYFQDQK